MDGTAIEVLAQRIKSPVEISGLVALPPDWTAKDPVSLVQPGPQAVALEVYSLGALVDYVKANRDALPLEKLLVHVVSPQMVRLLGPLQERARSRETFVQANAHNLTDGFVGGAKSIEDFIVGLQTRFVESADRAMVLKLVGNISQANVTQASDDGVSQAVTAKVGIAMVENATVPNPVNLAPFRTFREIDQPASLFVLRAQRSQHGNGLPTVALHEADGGAWRLRAIEDIGKWLKAELPANVAVLA